MSFFGWIKRTVKPVVDIPKWSGYRELVTRGRNLLELIKNVFTPQQASRHESFDAALTRLKLSEADLVQRQKIFSMMLGVWLTLFTLFLLYAIYLITQRAWLGVFPSLSFSCVMLIQAFRYHFWKFQIKQRKLGCNLKEWAEISFKKNRKGL